MTASLLDRFFPISAEAMPPGPADDFWYQAAGQRTATGAMVTQDTALKISAFFSCLRVIGETVLSAPMKVYRRLPNGDREEAPEHPLWPILHGDDPNDDQTSGEWLETHTIHTAMRGGSYSLIHPGERGPVTTVEYKHPDLVRAERLPSGRTRYLIKDEKSGTETPYPADRVYYLPGLSFNGRTGLSVLEYARETLGLSMALQGHASRSFANGVKPSGTLEHPGHLTEEAGKRLVAQFDRDYGGFGNTGKTILLEEGLKWTQVALSNADAEMLESERWQVADVARWFRMPLIMIQEYANSTNWGTGIEATQIGFIVFTMLPYFIRGEARINKQLIRPLGGDYFCEHIVEGLLRGDIKSRYEAYQIAAGGNAPWMNRQEIRKRENLNRGPAELDEFLQPGNMMQAGEPTMVRGRGTVPAQEQMPAGIDPRARTYAAVLARSLVHKEMDRVLAAAKRFADDGDGWAARLGTIYEEMGQELEGLGVSSVEARTYADQARDDVILRGVGALDGLQETKSEALVALMLKG